MFGDILKELRKSKGYSMEKLAELYNSKFSGKLNKSTISRYENGLQEPIFTTVKNFAELFQVTTDYLTDMNTAKTSSYNLPEITPPSEVDPDMFILDMYKKLDVEDKAEIRGEMKQMLKSSKYNKRKSDINAVFHTNSTDDNSAPLALQITTAKN